VISWRVVSADGHPVAGALTFSVGRPSAVVKKPPTSQQSSDGAVRGVLSAVEGVGYLGLFLAAGLVVFAVWLLPSVSRLGALRRRLRRVALGAALVAAAAGLLSLPLSGAYQQGLGLDGLAEGAGWAAIGGRELVALVLLAAGLAVAVGSLGTTPVTGRTRAVATAGAALAIVSPAVVGHSRAFSPQWLVVATDVLHVAAGAVWLGGLAGLALSLPALAGRSRAAAQTLARFSSLAAGNLLVLVASGSFLAWRIVGSWADLFGTTYGRLLIAKVMVAALAVGIAGWNRFALLPRVDRAEDNADRRKAADAIRSTIAVEAAVLVAVLLVTGFLVNQAPRQAPPVIEPNRTGVSTGQLGDDLRVLATLSPGTRGTNTVTVQLQDLTGEPFEPSRPPTVRVASATVDLGDVAVTPTDAGTFRAEVVIPTDGTYRVQVSLRLSEFENPVASLSFRVSALGR
jgi:copper transport protein